MVLYNKKTKKNKKEKEQMNNKNNNINFNDHVVTYRGGDCTVLDIQPERLVFLVFSELGDYLRIFLACKI